MQDPELILCNSYLQMGTEMHGDCRSTWLLSSAHCSGQRYPSSYKNDFPHITRNLWMRRLFYPACPKRFFLKVCQARSLRSCSCRGLQVQFCVGPLCFFWRLVSSNCSEDCPARGQEDKCTCPWTVVDLLCQLSGWLHQLPPNRHDTVANLQATPKPVLCSLLSAPRFKKSWSNCWKCFQRPPSCAQGCAALHCVTSVGYPADPALVSMVTLSVHL